MLTKKMLDSNVKIKLNSKVESIQRGDHFNIVLNDAILKTSSLVIACGGKSIPKIGASNFGYLIAEQFNLDIIKTRPALVPFIFMGSDLDATKPLAGMSLNARVSCDQVSFDDEDNICLKVIEKFNLSNKLNGDAPPAIRWQELFFTKEYGINEKTKIEMLKTIKDLYNDFDIDLK